MFLEQLCVISVSVHAQNSSHMAQIERLDLPAVGYILRKQVHQGKLESGKCPGGPRSTGLTDDHGMLQGKSRMLQSPGFRCTCILFNDHVHNLRGFATRCKTLHKTSKTERPGCSLQKQTKRTKVFEPLKQNECRDV